MKEEIGRKENLVSNLEAEAKEHTLEIEQLRSQIEANENDTSEMGREKLELRNSLETMRKEMDEQQRRVTELISVNEDLIAFSERKEDEVGRAVPCMPCLGCSEHAFLLHNFIVLY